MNNLSRDQKRIGDKMEFDMEYSLASGKIIGSGSFGSVYKLVSNYDNLEWAVKIIEVPDREEYRGSAEHEITIFQKMDSHLNIIGIKRVYSWINDLTHKFAAVIVQELADKGLYEEFMLRKKANMPYSEDEILSYLKQSVDGLHFIMTKNNIYHRDIKTENFLLKNNQIKITDFGVSKSIQAEKIRTLQTNTITGTPLFLSPKLWESYIKRSEFNVVHDLQKSDIFSLGLVFLQLTLLLSNPEMAGLNQPEGDKKLTNLLYRVRSNKLRTILASMLAFEEIKRADYNTILNYFTMKEIDFTFTQMHQYVNQNPVKTPIFGNTPVQQVQVGYRLIEHGAENKNTCSKHIKQIEYFCEYENCYEGLCAECRVTHNPSHISKVMVYKLAVSKYIDQNILSQSYMKFNTSINNEIRGKIQKYSSVFQDELQKTVNEMRKQILLSLDNSINKWKLEVGARLQNAGRDAELAELQVRSEERTLIENQQKFKTQPMNFYLKEIAKQQSQFEANISNATEKVQKIQTDIQMLSKIEQMYFNYMSFTSTFSRNLQTTFDNFLSDLILQQSEKSSQPTSVSSSYVFPAKGSNQPYITSNDNSPKGGKPKSSNFINNQSNLIQGQYQRNRSSETGKSLADKFTHFFSNQKNNQSQQLQNNFRAQTDRSKSPKETKDSKLIKSNIFSTEIEFTPIHPTKQYYITSNNLQELFYFEQTKQKHILLATQSDGKIIKINLQNEEKSEVSLHLLTPKCSLFLSNPRRMICATTDGKLFTFDPINMKVIEVFKETQNSSIICMATFEKKQQLLTGSIDGQVVLWNLEKKIQERVYQRLHQGEVRGIITNQNDAHMISVSSDKSIIITDLMTNKTIFTKQNAHYSSIAALKKVKENNFFTAGSDGYVKLWEWKGNSLEILGESHIHNSPITFLDYYPKYDLIVTSSSDGVIHFTDPTNYTQVASTQVQPLKGGAKGIHYQKPFLYTSDNYNIQKWDNPKFVQNLRLIKRRVKQKGSNCNIF